MNPFINDVVAAFGQVATHGTAIDIDRKGVSLPPGGHFQGIQRMPGEPPVLVITSSSTEKGYFVECDMEIKEHKGHARHPRTMATTAMDPPFNHAGGCQAFGHFLVAGLENSNTETNSEIQFWDFSGVPEKRPMTIPRPGSGHKHTAGAVGITSFERGTALAVATFNADTVDFLTSEADPFNGSPFKRHFTWAKDKAHKKGWIDQNFGEYQSINLITQADGQLFMVGCNRSGHSDWMDLYSVNLHAKAESALTKLAKRHMYCTKEVGFDGGTGIFIPSPAGFEVFAVGLYSGDHVTGTTIYVNHFAATDVG